MGGFSVTSVIGVNNAASESKEVNWLLPWALFLVPVNLKCIFAQRPTQKRKIGHHHFLLLCAIIYVAMF